MLKPTVWFLALTAVLLAAATYALAAPPDEPASQPTTQPAASQPAAPPPPPDRPDRPDRPSRRDRRATEAEVLTVLQERLPMRYQRLVELKETDPSDYARYLRGMRWWYAGWRHMPTAIQDADILQQTLSIRIWQLVDQIRQASDADRPSLQAELSDAVAKQFEAETVVMAYRLEMMEQALARMREHLADRREKADAFIADRIDHLLRATTQPADEHGPGRGGYGGFGPPGPPGDQPRHRD